MTNKPENNRRPVSRRDFLKQSGTFLALTGSVLGRAYARLESSPASVGRKVIIIGIDGMDPGLSERMMDQGLLPNFDKLRKAGGYRRLGTSIPPQSPVAWANFINGADPGSHGIFDFIHRDPEQQCNPVFSAAQTVPGKGYWSVGDYKVQLTFPPFGHKPPRTLLLRKGVPFWDYLDAAKIPSVFYDLPSNYPPSPSRHGHHRCISGMGVPDLLGTYGTYQYFAEDGPVRVDDRGGGRHGMLFFEGETARGELIGPPNSFLKNPKPIAIPFEVHRDKQAKAVAIDIQQHRIILKDGQWSQWIRLDLGFSTPKFMPDKHISGICRFYLQETAPNCRLYTTPINADPSEPAVDMSEPKAFLPAISQSLGLFYTTGFQEDHKALTNGVFTDEEFAQQAEKVLTERIRLLDYALKNYDDGLLFFYFSSTDLQAHMFWWDTDEEHPTRSKEQARRYFDALKQLYAKMDGIVGRMLERFGDQATIMVMSDHGFANFKRQFNINSWLRDNGYLYPVDCKSLLSDADWTKTRAYGLGINGLYLNLKGRERDGIVADGAEREALLDELVGKLEAVRDIDGSGVIGKVYRADKVYNGDHTELAPDLIIGFTRGYRASWTTCLGNLDEEVLSDNKSAWCADHCADAAAVPGILFCNRPIAAQAPSLTDLAPTVLAEFGLPKPSAMTGNSIFAS